eukprot:954127-Rhodomonas_salina.2
MLLRSYVAATPSPVLTYCVSQYHTACMPLCTCYGISGTDLSYDATSLVQIRTTLRSQTAKPMPRSVRSNTKAAASVHFVPAMRLISPPRIIARTAVATVVCA